MTNFVKCVFDKSDFRNAKLSGAFFNDADLRKIIFDKTTSVENTPFEPGVKYPDGLFEN